MNGPFAPDKGKRLQQNINALEMAHVAHVKYIGSILVGSDGAEFFRPQSIVNHGIWLAAKTNLLCKALPLEFADENHSGADARQGPFGRQEDKARKRQPAIMQTAAMRRVDRRDCQRARRQPAIKAALGAMAMNDINAEFLGMRPLW